MIDLKEKLYIHSENDKIIQIEEIKNIVYLESDKRKTKVYCSNGNQILVNKCLSFMEEKLPDENFFKIHKSFIINIDYLKSINYKDEKIVILKNNIKLHIACRKFTELKKFLKEKYAILQ